MAYQQRTATSSDLSARTPVGSYSPKWTRRVTQLAGLQAKANAFAERRAKRSGIFERPIQKVENSSGPSIDFSKKDVTQLMKITTTMKGPYTRLISGVGGVMAIGGARPNNQKNAAPASASLWSSWSQSSQKDLWSTTEEFIKTPVPSAKMHMAHGVSYNRIMSGLIAVVNARAFDQWNNGKKLDKSEFDETVYEYFHEFLKDEIQPSQIDLIKDKLYRVIKELELRQPPAYAMDQLSEIADDFNPLAGNLVGGHGGVNKAIGKRDDPASAKDGTIFPLMAQKFEAQNILEKAFYIDATAFKARGNEATNEVISSTGDYKLSSTKPKNLNLVNIPGYLWPKDNNP